MTSYALAGDVGVRVMGDAASRLVRAWLSAQPTREHETDLVVRDAVRAIDAPARARDAFFGEIDVWSEGSGHLLVAAGARARVERDVVDTLGDGTAPPWLGLLALALALRTRGIFHLHAGGVALDGATVLVVGGSGAGKTTTTLALLAHAPRAASLGDDTVFLGADGTVLATARPFHVTETTLAMFPTLASQVTGAVHEATQKLAVRPPAQAVTRAAPPRACLFPTITRDLATTAVRLPHAETLALLLAQSAVLAVPGVAARTEHLDVLARIADRAPGIALRLGLDAVHDPSRAASVALEAIAR